MYPSWWNERFIDLVTNHDADLQARDSHGKTVLHQAVNECRVQKIELLIERGANVNTVDDEGWTPLLTASHNRSKAGELVPLLIKHGADVTVRTTCGYNALHFLACATMEHTDLARVLIEKGASLDDRATCYQIQPIHIAAFEGKNKLLKVYLDHGANVNALTGDRESPLYQAAIFGNPAALLTLLKHGANIDLKSTDGSTALHRACDSRYTSKKDKRESIKILLSVGADMCVENNAGKTALATLIRCTSIKVRQSPNVRPMLSTLALRKACLQPSIEFKDEGIIEQCPELWTYYQRCIKQISKTKSTRLIDACTLFDLLTKCPCQIAALMQNSEFERSFRLIDLKRFFTITTYAKDILRAFKLAKLYHHSTLKQEDVINEAVHNILPWMVVRKVARYAVDCEECELKRIVHESR